MGMGRRSGSKGLAMLLSLRSLARISRASLFASVLGLAGVLIIGDGQAMAATASTLPCASANLAGDASGFGLDCQVLNAHNDKAADLNAEAAFTLEDWVFASKYEIDESKYETGVAGLGFAVTGGEDGGSFSFDDGLWDDWSSAVILFKSGSGKKKKKDDDGASAGSVVMFLIQPGVTMGDFVRSNGNGISHVSLYVSATNLFSGGSSAEAPTPAPLPAPALMLAAGLSAFGAVRARRRSA